MSLADFARPDGKPWTRIGDQYVVTKKPRDLDVRSHSTVPFIPMELVPQGGTYDPTFLLKSPKAMTSGTYFEHGDVLVAKITPSFENGKQALVRSLPQAFGYATTEVVPLQPKTGSKQDPRLLFFYLLHPEVRHFVAERMEGSTGRQRVPESVLLDLLMPDLDLQEQVWIADALERVQDALSVENKAALAAQDLKRASMASLLTRGLRGEMQKETDVGAIPASWTLAPLRSLGRIGNGTTPNRKHAPYWDGGTVPWITSGRMYEGRINGSDTSVTKTALAQCNLPVLEPGAVLMAIVGQGKTLGHCAVLNVRATASRHVGFIQPRTEVVLPEYLKAYLEHRYDYLRQLAAGNGSTRGALTGAILKAVPIPLPSVAEQREIVDILEAIDRKIAVHREKRAVLEELFKALLHKLMTGEISVNDLDLAALQTNQPGAEV
jgi:type I restriction enzyme, S subunit